MKNILFLTMRGIIRYVQQYIYAIHAPSWWFTTAMTGLFIYLNYTYGLDDLIRENNSFTVKLFLFYAVFASAFLLPWLFTSITTRRLLFGKPAFLFLALAAPMVFAAKMSTPVTVQWFPEESRNIYWSHILYWPVLLIGVMFILFIFWKTFHREQPFYGLKAKGISWKPYLLLLGLMIPLVAAASTQTDFLAMYPKLQVLDSDSPVYPLSGLHKLLYEISYGTDFISIEFFFRGFLVLAFAKWAGPHAILPMAAFYCTIHFGKPLGECISSYFGGMILGIVVYNTRSVYGGLMVHLGVAWLMELGGYIGNSCLA